MTDKEKIEKLLEHLERITENYEMNCPNGDEPDEWCYENCGDKKFAKKECFRHFLLGE